MSIVSYKFALFVISVFSIFYLLKPKYRVLFLAFASVIFIATYSYISLTYILFYTLINYYVGLKLQKSSYKNLYYRLGIVLNITQLILFRYASFAIDPFIKLFNSNVLISNLSQIIIPLGLSYYTLQGIGYLINIRRGWEKAERNYLHLLVYISFFPKFISGPIERSNHFLPQLHKNILFNEEQIIIGLKIILIGLFKEIAIANKLAPYALNVYSYIDNVQGYTSWILFLIQPLYLYFDFSGYTDIAIGLAKLFGLNLVPNFQRPFLAQNITAFWKRFHMSLSSWFNDYVFRPTSFNLRKWGISASVLSVFLTWTLFGIWHGAGWNYMLIGFMQAAIINYEYFTKKFRTNLFSFLPTIISIWVGRLLTYLFFSFSLVFFFSPTISTGYSFLTTMFSFNGPSPFVDMSLKPFEVIIYIPLILIVEILQNDYNSTYGRLEKIWNGKTKISRFIRWSTYSIIITIVFIAGFKSQQFVYANF